MESGKVTGLELKLARITRGVSQRDVAHRLAVSSQRIATLEATRFPTPLMCSRYAAALDAIAPTVAGPPSTREPSLDLRQILGTRRTTQGKRGRP